MILFLLALAAFGIGYVVASFVEYRRWKYRIPTVIQFNREDFEEEEEEEDDEDYTDS